MKKMSHNKEHKLIVILITVMMISLLVIMYGAPSLNDIFHQSWQCIEWQNITEDGQICSYSCHYPYGQSLSNETAECNTVCNSTNIFVPHCMKEILVRNVT